MNIAFLVGSLLPLVVGEAELKVVRLVGVRVVAAHITLVALVKFYEFITTILKAWPFKFLLETV